MAHITRPRMTLPTQMVLRALLTDPAQEMYGLQIGQAAALPSGTVHPILARLEACGWVQSQWEDADPAKKGRPRRRYYQLTRDGAELARNALARVRVPQPVRAQWNLGAVRPQPGSAR